MKIIGTEIHSAQNNLPFPPSAHFFLPRTLKAAPAPDKISDPNLSPLPTHPTLQGAPAAI